MNKWINVTQLVSGHPGFPERLTGFCFKVTSMRGDTDVYRVKRHDLKRNKIWAERVSNV